MPDTVFRSGQDSRALRRVSSLVLNSPGISARPEVRKEARVEKISHGDNVLKPRLEWDGEIVPDSEEERIAFIEHSDDEVKENRDKAEVIEISSDEDDLPKNRKAFISEDPFVVNIPGAWSADNSNSMKPVNLPSRKKKTPRSRRIIESASSDEFDDYSRTVRPKDPEVIELSDSSPERPNPTRRSKVTPFQRRLPASEILLPLFVDEDEPSNNDGSILTLNEPRTARRPIRLTPTLTQSSTTSPGPSLPGRRPEIAPVSSSSEDGVILISDPTPVGTPSRTRPYHAFPATPSTPLSSTSATKPRQPRISKKAQAVAEHARLETYARQLFTELNRVVFKDGLPKETKLNWNKRLLTTAGRAKWQRSRDGIHTTEIELAEKILDCEERIRNTLSHEMCHLACWIISEDPKENHGKIFQAWAAKVMQKHPDIEVSTTHDYEISYPFEWECEQCAKIYGRFTKSIRPDECVCGACKVGKLVPLFAAPQRAPKTPKTSRMAAGRTQDSPCSVPRLQSPLFDTNTRVEASPGREVYSVHDSDSDSEVAILATALGTVTIAASAKT